VVDSKCAYANGSRRTSRGHEVETDTRGGRKSTDDHDLWDWPSTAIVSGHVAKVRDPILQDRRLIIQDLCNTLGLSYGICQRISSEELDMRRTAAKLVP
jgi:hypothetical protein